MKNLFWLTLIILTACGPIYNTSTTDKGRFGVVSGTAEFTAASKILKTNCAVCHQHSAYGGMSESDFVQSGLVVPNNVQASSLYTKLKNNTTSTQGNMPDGAEALSTEQIQAIQDWINSISL